MIRNYLKSVIRQAVNNRLNSIINLTGLSVAIACCIIISLFIADELSYDKFHNNSENIYRITTQENEEGTKRFFAHSYLPVAPLLKSTFSEIKEIVRLFPQSVGINNKEKNIALQESYFYYVDSNFFKVFTFNLTDAEINSFLNQPDNLVITDDAARKYFGESNVIGKELLVEKKIFKIAGVINKIPNNSSIRFEVLAPLSSAKYIMGDWIFNYHKTWYHPPVYTFALFNNSSGAERVQHNLKKFEKDFLPDYITKTRSHSLQKLSDIHFSSLENELQPTARKSSIYLFTIIGFVILLLAAFNFINLFLARIVYRLKTVGIQKVMGATRKNIWWQTCTESVFFLFTSLFLALIWVILFVPIFNDLMSKQLELFSPHSIRPWIFVVSLLLTTAFLTSIFPSFLISHFKLIEVLKGKRESLFPRKKIFSLQSSFVVFQFVIAIVLIASTIVMQVQIHFIRNKDLGLKKEQTLIVPVRDEAVQNKLDAVKAELSGISSIKNVSAISNFPWEKGFYDFETTINANGKEIKSNAPTLLVDKDFIKTMNMKMLQGRGFSADLITDITSAFIFNESAAKKFGIGSIENVKVTMSHVASGKPKKGELIGIVKDFHLQSLHEPIEPLILTVSPEAYYMDNIVISLSSTNIPESLKEIEATLKKIVPGKPVDYFFLDEAFDKLYKRENRMVSIFKYFSIIAIIIACMGLFGIVAFSAVQRTKEIGIRKTLGASVQTLVMLISKQFLLLVIIAILIAVPIAWYFSNQWLQDFAYRTNITWWMFTAAGLTAFMIALVTVSFHSIKASIANPVTSLRSE